MPRSWTTSDLVASFQRRSFLPQSQSDFSPSSVIALLNEQLLTDLVPWIARERLEIWIKRVTLGSPSTYAPPNTTEYELPADCIATRIRTAVALVGGRTYPLPFMDHPMALSLEQGTIGSSQPFRYYWASTNRIGVWPSIGGASGAVRIAYVRAPNNLVPNANCLQITGFPLGAIAGNYRMSFAGGVLPNTGFLFSQFLDLCGGSTPFQCYTGQPGMAGPQFIYNTTVSWIEVTGVQPPTLAIGDWMCPAGDACVVTDTPQEILPLLIVSAIIEALRGKGNAESYQRLKDSYQAMKDNLSYFASPRDDAAMEKVPAISDTNQWPFFGGTN